MRYEPKQMPEPAVLDPPCPKCGKPMKLRQVNDGRRCYVFDCREHGQYFYYPSDLRSFAAARGVVVEKGARG